MAVTAKMNARGSTAIEPAAAPNIGKTRVKGRCEPQVRGGLNNLTLENHKR